MLCPLCKNQKLEKIVFFKNEIDYCPTCLGLWFDSDELRRAKDDRDKDLNWLDIDIWSDKDKFKILLSPKSCPKCSVPMYAVNYGDSKIMIDVCNLCQGVWLDRGEFKKIVEYLKRKGHFEIINNYFRNFLKEGAEVFNGPETFGSELADFLAILKLLKHKLQTQYPAISKFISSLPLK